MPTEVSTQTAPSTGRSVYAERICELVGIARHVIKSDTMQQIFYVCILWSCQVLKVIKEEDHQLTNQTVSGQASYIYKLLP